MESDEEEASETLPLDEPNELYGYGILNVHQNSFLKVSAEHHTGYFENDHLVREKEQAIEAMKRIASEEFEDSRDVGDLSHLRVVEVRLANDLDKEAVEEIEEQLREVRNQ